MNKPSESSRRRDHAWNTDAAYATHPSPASYVVDAAVLSIAFTALWIHELVAPTSALRLFY
jgi:hypothetical protein